MRALAPEGTSASPNNLENEMTLKLGAFWPLVEIDVAVGLIGCMAAIGWARRPEERWIATQSCFFAGCLAVYL
jgi:hypothetical protein